ncbi:hypothetical protein R3J22_02500 [Trueperella bernardiae]|uniref:hypothetical protein n=1 Tax=Trueperella bernardiae TaxID=59561 RepID=UPI00294A7276|nr:hypothetical protein [Trueperella bernardiae]MDV6238398.1 hypothetical protein [Trueperella bernardiae]
MTINITALYDAHVAKHPHGVTTADTRAYLKAQVKQRLEHAPRDLDTEADNLVAAQLPRLREKQRNLVRANITRIIDNLTSDDAQLDVEAISTIALPTGDPAGIDKTLRFWTLADAQLWLEARRQHKDAALAAFQADLDTIGRLSEWMYAKSAVTIGDLIADTPEGGDLA